MYRISAYFSTFPNQSSRKSKKQLLWKNEISDILKTSCQKNLMKFLEINNYLSIYILYLAKVVEQNFMKQSFLVNKKILVSETKPNTVHLK